MHFTILIRDVFKDTTDIKVNMCNYINSDVYYYMDGFKTMLGLLLQYNYDNLEIYVDTLTKLYEPEHFLTVHQCITSEILYLLSKSQVDEIYGIDKLSSRNPSRYKASDAPVPMIFNSLQGIECSKYVQEHYTEFLQIELYYVLCAPFSYMYDIDDCSNLMLRKESYTPNWMKQLRTIREAHMCLINKILEDNDVCKNIAKYMKGVYIKEWAKRFEIKYQKEGAKYLKKLAQEASKLKDKSKYVALIMVYPELRVEVDNTDNQQIIELRKQLIVDNEPNEKKKEAEARFDIFIQFINQATDVLFEKATSIIEEFIFLNSISDGQYSLFKQSQYDVTNYYIEREDRAIAVMQVILDVIENFDSNSRTSFIKSEFGYYYTQKGYKLPYAVGYHKKNNKFKFQQMTMLKVLSDKYFVLGKCIDVERHKKILRYLTMLEMTYL